MAQLGSDEPDLLTLGVVLVLVLLVAVLVGLVVAGAITRERSVAAAALNAGSGAAVLFGMIRLAVWGQDRPDEELLDRFFGIFGWIWLAGMVVAGIARWRGWPAVMDPLLRRPTSLPGLLLRYSTFTGIGYAVAGMLGLSVVLLVTSQLTYSFIEARRAAKRARPRGMDEIWYTEP